MIVERVLGSKMVSHDQIELLVKLKDRNEPEWHKLADIKHRLNQQMIREYGTCQSKIKFHRFLIYFFYFVHIHINVC